MKGWLASGAPEFRFLSIDHDAPLLCLTPARDIGLAISSPWEIFSLPTPLQIEAVRSEFGPFAAEVTERCNPELGVDPTSVIEEYLSR